MSVKITEISLDGRARKLTRVRAERLVEKGSHQWQGERTIREVRQAHAVSPVHNRIRVEFQFDHFYPPPGAGPLPGDHPLPYTYPLPYDLLVHYQGGWPAGFEV